MAAKDATDIVLKECSVENEDRACLADCQCTGCHFHYRLIIVSKVFYIIIFDSDGETIGSFSKYYVVILTIFLEKGKNNSRGTFFKERY